MGNGLSIPCRSLKNKNFVAIKYTKKLFSHFRIKNNELKLTIDRKIKKFT